MRICGICVTKNSYAGDNSQIHCEAKILIIAEKFSNSQILDEKRKSVRICRIYVTKNSSAGDNSQIHCEAKILIIAEKFSNSLILDKKENL